MPSTINPGFFKMHYSLSRYYVDCFYAKHITKFKKKALILDVGGIKNNKRGQFKIEDYDLNIKYLNIVSKTNPDFLCDAIKIPVKKNHFDGIICSQLLEHVAEPPIVLKEIYRVLKPKGKLLLTVPFIYRIHPDPNDYGRYTDQYWKEILRKIGFTKTVIEKQGFYYSVLADLIKSGVKQMQTENKPKNKILKSFLVLIVGFIIKLMLKWETKDSFRKNPFYNSFTTGFGIVATK